ncbi:hypothetical protein [Stappia sp. MMSF_3263]|uniref:hypothetical protein n=1 Tax=Stappia sp. MMSF_3263 TaxID=3046693 RepID=UPI00273DE7FB|nr:hypothetical protein [Stappia sp. MMSF_3263]
MSWSLRWENHWSGRAQDSARASSGQPRTASSQTDTDIPSAPAIAAAHAALARIAQGDHPATPLTEPAS